MAAEAEKFLRQLAASDEACLTAVLSPDSRSSAALDRRTRALVQLSALLATDAGTTTLRWAVDVACSMGVGDAALVQVLLSEASAAGVAQTVSSAPRLALALGVDLEVAGWDET